MIERIEALIERDKRPGKHASWNDAELFDIHARQLVPLMLKVIEGYRVGYPELQPPLSLAALTSYCAERLPEVSQ